MAPKCLSVNVDWAAYGTEDLGHALLGASGDISVASELTQFTDRPGNPPSGHGWGPVTSGFPFKGFYVVLRTMPDIRAKRSGMVRSYAAFVPLDALGEINSLTELVGAMPTESDFAISKKLERLAVSNQSPQLVDTDSKEFETTILGLCAPEIEQPVVWGMEKDYLPTLDTIWSKIPVALRQKFSFAFQFAPDHPSPVPSAFIATVPGFVNRWSGKWIVDGTPSRAEVQSGISEWFQRDSKISDLEEMLRSYGLHLQTFQELRILEQFSAFIKRRESLDFEELTKAIRILERFSDDAAISGGNARTAIFEQLCERMSAASSQELLTLRNLKAKLLPELIEPAQNALKAWLVDAETSDKAGEIVELIEAAVDAPDNWWSEPFIEWLKEMSSKPSLLNAKRLVGFILRSQKASIFTEQLRFTDHRWEGALLDILPDALNEVNRSNATVLSAKQRWHRVSAYCVSQVSDRQVALSTYADSSNGSKDGYHILLREWGFLGLLEAADERRDVKALAFLSAEIGKHLGQVSEIAVLRLKHSSLLLPLALADEIGPLEGRMRKWVSLLINRDGNSEISKAALGRDVSILLDLKKPVSVVSALAEAERPGIRQSFSEVVVTGFLDQRFLSDEGEESWIPLLDLDLVSRRLAEAPFAAEGQAAIAAFNAVDVLTDEHCAGWLAEYFRVSNEKGGVGDKARKGIINLLRDRDFPRSAQIVKETVEQFHRDDASPILEAIRERYQGLNPTKKKIKSMGKLPKIFIATALPLEYEAVKSNLVDREYDQDLEADVGLWPSSDAPLANIYLSITGAGNLASQASVLEIFRRVKPDCAFFMGIGGGIKDLDIGDVAYGTQVDYIEGGKESGKGDYASRPKTEQTNRKLVNLAHRIASDAQDPKGSSRIGYKVLPTVIVSGENVLSSKEDEAVQFQIIKKHYNDGQVIEMEGFGFMSAARIQRIEFCMILRGISDLCKGKGEDSDLRDQPLAAKNATDFLFRLLPECLPLVTPKGRWKKFKERFSAWKKGHLSS